MNPSALAQPAAGIATSTVLEVSEHFSISRQRGTYRLLKDWQSEPPR
ncbi:hypothetical protein [Nostoc sp.]